MKKMKPLKYVIALLCILIFLGGVFGFGKWVKRKWIVHVTLNSSHWKERVTEMESLPRGKYKTIFLGNSLTELFDLEYYFKDSTILNCGIVGDFSEGLIKRSAIIIQLKPEKLFIDIGINDMIEQISLKDICNNYEELIGRIKRESPNTRVYIQSNLPVIINRPSILTSDKDVNDLVKEQNENLKELAKRTECTYVDVYSSFIKEKDKESLFIWDGIHLTPKAYAIWAGVLRPYLLPESER